MNKLAQAIQTLKEQDGLYSAENLTLYKKASASTKLGEDYPRIADAITQGFYKQACVGDTNETILRSMMFARGFCKIAGAEFNEDVAMKLAATAVMNKEASDKENDQACYALICGITKEANFLKNDEGNYTTGAKVGLGLGGAGLAGLAALLLKKGLHPEIVQQAVERTPAAVDSIGEKLQNVDFGKEISPEFLNDYKSAIEGMGQ